MAAEPARVEAIPEGYHTVAPYLVVHGAERDIEFYKKAFGARERACVAGPGELLMHAEVKIGDSVVMLCDEMHGWNSGAHSMSCSIS